MTESRYGGVDASALPATWRQGFAETGGGGKEQQRADNGKDDKDTTPGGEAKQQPTEDRGKDWRKAVHEHEQREEPGGSDARMQVAHDGTRDDDTGGTGKALYKRSATSAYTDGATTTGVMREHRRRARQEGPARPSASLMGPAIT